MWLPRLLVRLFAYGVLALLGGLGLVSLPWTPFLVFLALVLAGFGALAWLQPTADSWWHRLTPLPDLGVLHLLVAGSRDPMPWDGLAYVWVAGLAMNTFRREASWLVPAWGLAAWLALVTARPYGPGWAVWATGHGLGLALLTAVSLRYVRERWDHRRDALTGTLVRRAGLEELRALAQAGRAFQLAFVDLRSFKEINDELGHAVGDEVLAAVGGRLLGAVRDEDPVIRFGGDEFLVASAQPDLRRRIEAALAEPIRTSHGEAQVHADVGIAQWRPGDSLEALLREADARMYAGKRRS